MMVTVAAANGETNTPSAALRKSSKVLSGSGNTSSGDSVTVTVATVCPGAKVTVRLNSSKSSPAERERGREVGRVTEHFLLRCFLP